MSRTFRVMEDHLKLMNRMFVSWEDSEYAAPSINCKRPYGNRDVEGDIAEIIDWPLEDDELSGGQSKRTYELHHETQRVLQIILKTGSFKLGVYSDTDDWSTNWEWISY